MPTQTDHGEPHTASPLEVAAARDALHWDFDLGVLHAAADALVDAVHSLDPIAVEIALARAEYEFPRPGALRALVVLLAAATAEDTDVEHLVSWVGDPPEYARLRRAGLTPALARHAMAEPHDRTVGRPRSA